MGGEGGGGRGAETMLILIYCARIHVKTYSFQQKHTKNMKTCKIHKKMKTNENMPNCIPGFVTRTKSLLAIIHSHFD